MEFQQLADCLQQVQGTSKRLEKTALLANFLRTVPADYFFDVVLLLQGKVYEEYEQKNLGVSVKLILKALHQASGVAEVDALFNEKGDVGLVAEHVMAKKQQQSLFVEPLTITHVFSTLRKLPDMVGASSVDKKLSVLAGLFGQASVSEAKYLAGIVIEQLRAGIAAGVLRDAIVWSTLFTLAREAYPDVKPLLGEAYPEEKNEVHHIEDLLPIPVQDYPLLTAEKTEAFTILRLMIDELQRGIDVSSSVATAGKALAFNGLTGLRSLTLQVFRPLHVMLAQKVESIDDAFTSLGEKIAVEYKYDGFRVQIHSDGNTVRLFTRRLEEVTVQFPDVVALLEKHLPKKQLIFDGEIIGVDKTNGKYLPFQAISQRIRRKYDIEKLSKEFPVDVRIFDVMFFDKQVIELSFEQRRSLIESSLPKDVDGLGLSKLAYCTEIDEVMDLFTQAMQVGNEGLMIKGLQSVYQPGARVGSMLKYKEAMETLDVVIVGATKGEGKRSSWLTSFTVACRSLDGELVALGKVSTGFKELEAEGTSFSSMTALLEPLITEDHGKEVSVRPEVVIEVAYEEIQASTTYASGYALRFPRFMLLRDDRGVEDISGIDYVELLYNQQRGRNT